MKDIAVFLGVLLSIVLAVALLTGWTMINMALIGLIAGFWGIKIAGGLLAFFGILLTAGEIIHMGSK